MSDNLDKGANEANWHRQLVKLLNSTERCHVRYRDASGVGCNKGRREVIITKGLKQSSSTGSSFGRGTRGTPAVATDQMAINCSLPTHWGANGTVTANTDNRITTNRCAVCSNAAITHGTILTAFKVCSYISRNVPGDSLFLLSTCFKIPPFVASRSTISATSSQPASGQAVIFSLDLCDA